MVSNILLTYLEDIDWTPDGLKTVNGVQTPFSQEEHADINTLISFYQTSLTPLYAKCVFYESMETPDTPITDADQQYKATLKLFNWYKKHIDAINDIKTWYAANRANILNNEMKSVSKTKTSDTPQDGEDYTDTYPTTQANVESTVQSKDNISFLNSLAKKYHNYMNDFVALFIRECGLYYSLTD